MLAESQPSSLGNPSQSCLSLQVNAMLQDGSRAFCSHFSQENGFAAAIDRRDLCQHRIPISPEINARSRNLWELDVFEVFVLIQYTP